MGGFVLWWCYFESTDSLGYRWGLVSGAVHHYQKCGAIPAFTNANCTASRLRAWLFRRFRIHFRQLGQESSVGLAGASRQDRKGRGVFAFSGLVRG